jgi:hypothetical protein
MIPTLAGLATAPASHAALLVSEAFSYSSGDLSGNSGGTGFSGAWSGGGGANKNQVLATSIFEPGNPSARSVQIASIYGVTTRSLASTYVSGGATTFYVSFLFNANSFESGNHFAGIGLAGPGASDSLFFGMPGNTGNLGFDWNARGTLTGPASSNVNYLVLAEIKAGVGATTTVSMFATTDLSMGGSALMTTTPIGVLSDMANFTFDSVNIAGTYTPGSIQLGRFAIADNPNEAIAFSGISAVPLPGASMLATVALSVAGTRRRRTA